MSAIVMLTSGLVGHGGKAVGYGQYVRIYILEVSYSTSHTVAFPLFLLIASTQDIQLKTINMTFKTLDFKCALVTGGGGGIGKAISEYFLSQGKKVIICGRTESKLQEASKSMKDCPYYVLDTGNLSAIPDFIKKITTEHSDLDCVVNNAGVQRPLDVNEMKADEFTQKADQEINININGPMHLTIGLLPHFRQKSGAVIMNVSSVLGYIPTSIINPVSLPRQRVGHDNGPFDPFTNITRYTTVQRHGCTCGP